MEISSVAREASELPEHLRLSALEELWGIPIGTDEMTAPLPSGGVHTGSPREALEEVVLAALQRPPCLVSFSGGVDSSTVLAVAAHVARREGLALPIPATNCFPDLAEADEADWQERVVDHLQLDDWIRLDWQDELDVVGPLATRLLERHGILIPFNSHFHYPLLERAAGGSLLTGFGGDELFDPVDRATAAHIIFGHSRPSPRDLPALMFGLAPRWVRTIAAIPSRPYGRFAWIRPRARWRLAWTDTAWDSREPLRWDRSLRDWWWPTRMLQCCVASMNVMGADFDVRVESPLAAREVLAACAQAGGAIGLGSRPRALHTIVGDLLPSEILGRGTKASFNEAFWNRYAREFVASWDGRGIDPRQVSADALRAEWAIPKPDAHSFVQLHRAWLASRA
jgi:Asparagine synthase